ncbi:hypothetical protein [Polycladidibacter hongkongensis]|uniref:hypothetical protein n=1 Tax=Polycladidibacter hongkongensis TaxID=1647556 RepID=UPI0008327A33|nr:hypothetical protein [Pseudovibrio hongkongensis]
MNCLNALAAKLKQVGQIVFSVAAITLPQSASAAVFDLVLDVTDGIYDPAPAGDFITYDVTIVNSPFGVGSTASSATTLSIEAPDGTLLTDITGTTCTPLAPLDGPTALSG